MMKLLSALGAIAAFLNMLLRDIVVLARNAQRENNIRKDIDRNRAVVNGLRKRPDEAARDAGAERDPE